MKSSAPWSVKGIERDARETAKEAARREGMTVGEWLNHMIYSAGEEPLSGGDVEGLRLRDIITAIEHLHKRVADNHADNAGASQEITRTLGAVVERVQRLERVKPAPGGSEELAARVARLESGGGAHERVNALKALEKAVSQVAGQFSETQSTSVRRLDSVERQMQDLAARIDATGAAALQGTIDALARRVTHAERIAADAAETKAEAPVGAEFIESTGNRLRVLGDEIKRGGDQIHALEGTIAKLSGQIDAAERRSAEGIEKVAETIAELHEQFAGAAGAEARRATVEAAVAAAAQESEERMDAMERALGEVTSRLEALARAPGPTAPAIEETVEIEARDARSAAFAGADGDDEDEIARGGDDAEARAFESEAPDGAAEDAPAQEPEAAESIEAAAEEEDPFAFVDEIDASFDAPETDSDDIDFRFEIDSEPEEEIAAADATEEDAGEAASGGETGGPDDDAEDGAQARDEIEAVLAELDELTGPATSDGPAPDEDDDGEADEDDEDAPLPPAAAADAPAPTDPAEDDIDEQREGSKGVFGRQAPAPRPRRSQLSPKQRAILAARARQKRTSADGGATAKPDPIKISAAMEALRDNGAETGTADEEAKRGFSRIAGALAGIGAKLPFIGRKEPEAPAAGASDSSARARDGDRIAFETLKETAAARPVTLALAIGILLSIVALFYLMKDIAFAPNEQPAIASAGPASTTQPAQTPDLEAPAPPAIDPRELYIDAMAALDASKSEDEAAAAVTKLQEAAALGHPPAQLQLGELYKTGQGVDQDLRQARTWFRRAASGGNILAMHRIGVMTARGDGGPADTREAIDWFERAGNRGLVDSQYNLGAIYHPSAEGGATTVQDAGKAYYWYSLAVRNGDAQAGELAESVGALLSVEQKRGLDEAIAEWEAIPADAAANELAPSE